MKRNFSKFLMCVLLCGCRGPTGPPGAGFESLSDKSILPKIIFTDPAAGTVGPFDSYNQIQLRFNKTMDLPSLRHAIQFASTLNDIVADTNGILSANGDLVTVSARTSTGTRFAWRVGQSYTMTVSESAADVNGNHLSAPFSMTILPEPYFRVRTVSPKNNAVNISSKTRPTLSLNSPSDASVYSNISISPPVAGYWTTSSTNKLSYRTLVPLDVQTQYTVTIAESAHDVFGNYLPAQVSFRFTTVPFHVSSTTPANGGIGIPTASPAYFYLNASSDTSTVRQAFSVQPPVSGMLSYSGTRIQFTPAAGWRPSTTYRISISTQLRTASGKNLLQPYVLTFTTSE